MSPISILLMMIVDTVAQVAAKGQWSPCFDISHGAASLHFRPAGFDYLKPTGTWPKAETIRVRIVPMDQDDEPELLEELQAMLAFARRHLETAPEA
ncbi:conserved hypothetical protein [Pseudomonas sp. OF001]|uniref:hypothetical protein n=1 Tax=Pseudomonas sp. OF001 TaxID=2772300 RepID=UPI001917BD3A|nr:hypothetical protein [Pseudomonas sp. OF001]CAD5377121.1 conserved hypothetical protein [Pseudomonas sp. OF001]